MSALEKVGAGRGRIRVQSDGNEAVLSELSYSYPLKLLSPRLSHPNVAVVYVLTYGGGLVAGDFVDLNVRVEDGTALVLLTQVSAMHLPHMPTFLTENDRARQRSSRHALDNVMHVHRLRISCLRIHRSE